jgi:hypothetical protein
MELKWKYLDELYREKYFDKDVPPVYLKAEADKVIARHKYKLCLAMAKVCMHKRWRNDEGFDYARSTRHMNKWLDLAEKFKEGV